MDIKLITGILIFLCNTFLYAQTNDNPADWANPFIGTSNKGNVHPGAVVPWGMASVVPHTVNTPKGAYYYQYGDPFIYGFGHVQLNGVGCGDAGNIVFMAVSDKNIAMDSSKRKSKYTAEMASPGYYKCFLKKPKTTVEATATMRSGRTKFTFSEKEGGIVLDLRMSKSRIKGGALELNSDGTVQGYQMAGAFCDMPFKRKVYFVIKPIGKAKGGVLFAEGKWIHKTKITGNNIGVYFPADDTVVQMAVGISFVSIANARENLEKEQQGLNFEEIQMKARESWNRELRKVTVSSNNDSDLVKFYSAYYRVLISPSVINDFNGQYLSMQTDAGRPRIVEQHPEPSYSIFSLWDTYRTVHPWLTLLHPVQQNGMMNSMLQMYKQGGWLPKWELFGQESWVMVGDPAPIVLADSYMKGITNIDTATLVRAMLKGGLQTQPQNMLRPGNENYWKYGYIPIDKRGGKDSTKFTWTNGYVWGTVSTTLEYQFADYNIAQFLNTVGRENEAQLFLEQSQKFPLSFDSNLKHFRPRLADGTWKRKFDPKARSFDIRWQQSGGHGFVEGDAWAYRFFVPHGQRRLIELFGGAKAYADTLQKLFDDGHYDMTNEPGLSFPYLFNYAGGEEWRAQKQVQYCIQQYFHTGTGGIPGNDDAGTMSAWLLFSMLGLYPDCPGNPDYQITLPSFKKSCIQLDPDYYPGKTFTVTKKGNGETIKRIVLNGKQHNQYTITHQQIINGGELIIETE